MSKPNIQIGQRVKAMPIDIVGCDQMNYDADVEGDVIAIDENALTVTLQTGTSTGSNHLSRPVTKVCHLVTAKVLYGRLKNGRKAKLYAVVSKVSRGDDNTAHCIANFPEIPDTVEGSGKGRDAALGALLRLNADVLEAVIDMREDPDLTR